MPMPNYTQNYEWLAYIIILFNDIMYICSIVLFMTSDYCVHLPIARIPLLIFHILEFKTLSLLFTAISLADSTSSIKIVDLNE